MYKEWGKKTLEFSKNTKEMFKIYITNIENEKNAGGRSYVSC